MTYFLYILSCSDNSLYSGITTNLDRRVQEHNQSKRGAKYTRSRRPCTLVYSQEFDSRSAASIAEHKLKKLSHVDKLNLVKPKS